MFPHAMLILALCLTLTGCQTPVVDQPLVATVGGSEPEQQMEFWHQLTERKAVGHDDAFHATLLFLDGQDPAADYAARVELLKSKGLLNKSFNKPGNQAITRGTLAVVLVRALQIKGGVLNFATGGGSPRYAVRELAYKNLYPPSSPHQFFTGTELVGVFGKMEDYQRTRPAPAQAQAAAPQP
jgi:hypothetical protein